MLNALFIKFVFHLMTVFESQHYYDEVRVLC